MARSIEAAFQFLSFKIDHIEADTTKNLGTVNYSSGIDPESLDLELSLRGPTYFKGEDIYMGGLDARWRLFASPKKEDDELLFRGRIGVVGSFKMVSPDELTEEQQEQLVMVQIPAILLPYLRSAITSIFSVSGFSSLIVPLINIHKVAENARSRLKLEVIDG